MKMPSKLHSQSEQRCTMLIFFIVVLQVSTPLVRVLIGWIESFDHSCTFVANFGQHIWIVAYHPIRHQNLIHHKGLILQTQAHH